jgi:hypothetical protein
MLKKRVEKDGKVKCIYKSSNILASTYVKENNDLTIIFNNGGVYLYKDVKGSDYLRFETADSQGQIFNSNIKTNPFEKQDKVDVKVILEELTRVELEETNQLKKELIDSMNSVSIIFESTGEVDRQLLKEVEMNIKLFKGEAINE